MGARGRVRRGAKLKIDVRARVGRAPYDATARERVDVERLMLLTVIRADQETRLSIETPELVYLEELHQQGKARPLEAGAHELIIGPGLFRVVSDGEVKATAPTDLATVWRGPKDGPPPNQSVLGTFASPAASDFLASLRSYAAPT